MNNSTIDVYLDFETLGKEADTVVLDASVLFVPYDNDYDFDTLVSKVHSWKFDVKSQTGIRSVDSSVLDWWKKQDPEAKKVLVPSDKDVSLTSFVEELYQLSKSYGVCRDTIGWCRGQDFDMPIMRHIIRNNSSYNDDFLFKFWNQRDIRSFLSGLLVQPLKNSFNVNEDKIPGFVKHNSAHDVAKAVIEVRECRKFINEI